jgi:MFS family permease
VLTLDKVNDEAAPREASDRWFIVVLLLLSVCINYIDRGSLSVTVPVLKKEFSLSPEKLGYLLSAFFWSYTVCQLFVGWLVDRYNMKWIYAGGFLIWSLAMAGTGLVNSFAAFFVARLFLGIGESVFLPSASRIMVRLFQPAERGLPNALVDVGTKVGPALSMLIGGFVLAHYGWRALFIWVGLASLLWLVPWIVSVPGEFGVAAPLKPASVAAHVKNRASIVPQKNGVSLRRLGRDCGEGLSLPGTTACWLAPKSGALRSACSLSVTCGFFC